MYGCVNSGERIKTGKLLDLPGAAVDKTDIGDVRFIDNRDGTITDRKTSLMWPRNGKMVWKAVSWEEAVVYCEKLQYASHADWRLPTKKEWITLIDMGSQNPALPGFNPFTNIITYMDYWSITGYKAGRVYAWSANLYYGKINILSKR